MLSDVCPCCGRKSPRKKSTPLIEGTNIPVYRISALLQGELTIEQVMEDFPSLTRKQIVDAGKFAKKHPNIGDEYPPVSFKRLLMTSGFSKVEAELRKIKKMAKPRSHHTGGGR